MTAECSAPREGHATYQGALRCPLHGPRMRQEAGLAPTPPVIPPSQASQFAGSTTPPSQRRLFDELAEEDTTPAEVLLAIAEDTDFSNSLSRGQKLLMNPNAPASLLLEVRDDPEANDSFRAMTLGHENMPAEIADRVARDSSASDLDRSWARRHPSLRDNPEAERRWVGDKSTPMGMIVGIARDSKNEDIVIAAIERVIQDGSYDQRKSIFESMFKYRDAVPERLVEAGRPLFEMGVTSGDSFLGKPWVTPQMGHELLAAADEMYRRGTAATSLIARDDVLPETVVMAARAGNESAWEHPKMPPEMLVEAVLGRDSRFRRFREHALENPALPMETLREYMEQSTYSRGTDSLIAIARNRGASADILEQIARESRADDVHAALASNPATPVAMLARMTKRKSTDLRVRSAENPSTPLTAIADAYAATPNNGRIRKAARARAVEAFGIDPSNDAALDSVMSHDNWGEFTADSAEVALARAMFVDH